MRRSVSIVACFVAVFLFGASPAMADGGDGGITHNNVIQAENSNSASPVVRTGTAFAYDAGTSVTDTNIAYAHSFNCTGCRTVAVAVQVVVVQGSPSNYQPQNGAVAVNENCNSCQTFAYAHQYVIQTFHPVSWQEGYGEQLRSFQWKISQVAHSNEDFATMSSQLDQLSLQYYNAVYQAVQSQNQGDGGERSERRQVQEK